MVRAANIQKNVKASPWKCQRCNRLMLVRDQLYYKCPICGAEVWEETNEAVPYADDEDPKVIPRSYVHGTCDGKNVDKTGKSKPKYNGRFIPLMDFSG